MNSLLLLNGSPRGERSNTNKMLARVAEGWLCDEKRTATFCHLAQRDAFSRAVTAFASADAVILGMPLYTDSMPALVKTYIEALEPYVVATKTRSATPLMGFLVQSGFPEALHSRPIERYLQKLAGRLGAGYAGTIVRGGGEALQAMPDKANQKLWARLQTLGRQLAQEGRFGTEEMKAVAGMERLPKPLATLAKLACKVPVTQFYWTSQLKKNGAWKDRFAAPYGEPYR
jgi:FMN-dependent NADH-azoreductase